MPFTSTTATRVRAIVDAKLGGGRARVTVAPERVRVVDGPWTHEVDLLDHTVCRDAMLEGRGPWPCDGTLCHPRSDDEVCEHFRAKLGAFK
jgi:hypothetical protein